MPNLKWNRLKHEWKACGLRNIDIAKITNLSPTAISNKNKGKLPQELTATQLYLVCQVIGKPMDMFFDGIVCQKCFSQEDVIRLDTNERFCRRCLEGEKDE